MTITFGDNNPLTVEDGSIQIDSDNGGSLKFQLSGQNSNVIGEIDSELDQTNGGQIGFYTKENNGIVTKKMFIDHLGSVNILTENGVFAITNNFLSQQSRIYNSQFGDKDLTIDAYSNATAKGIRFFTNSAQRMRINFSGALGFGSAGSFGNPGEILQSNGSGSVPSWTSTLTNMTTAGTFNINSVLQLGGSNGNSGQYLKSNGNAVPSWENLPAAGTVGTQTTSTTSTSSVYYPLVSSSSGAQTDETPIKHSYFQFNTSTLSLKLINPYTINSSYPFIAPALEGTWGLNLISNIGGVNFLADSNNSGNNALFFSHSNPNTFSPTSVRDNSYELGSNGRRWAAVWAANGTIQTSDDRLKINEKPITGALKLINNLEYYEYDKVKTPDGTDVTHKERGIIAQHLLNTDLSYTLSGGKTETIKDPVSTETKYIPYGVKYNDLFVTLCSAVKELNTLVNTLEARIKTLESK